MRRIVTVVVLGLAAAGIRCGSGEFRSAPPPGASDPPRRIVSLTPALTETLFAIGLGERVVGVTDYCNQPPEAASRTRVGGYANPSAEAILALRPDLVVVSPGPGNREAALAVERAGIAVAVFRAETLEESLETIRAVAERCGAAERGRALEASIRERLDAVARRVAGAPRPRVLFVVETEPIIAAGVGTLPSDLLAIAGGENVVTAERYPRLGVESVLHLDPDLVVQSRMDAALGSPRPSVSPFWSRWPDLRAVRESRIHVLDGDAALRAGPRVAEGAEQLAAILHPGAAR